MEKEQSSMKCRHCSHYGFSCTWCYEQKQVHYPLDEACNLFDLRECYKMVYERNMNTQKLIDLSISYFEQIAEMTHRLTTGNVSHQGATIRAYARSAAEYLEIELKDISSSENEYELIRLSKIWFQQAERYAARLTSGNVSHSGCGLRGFVLRCREYLIKHRYEND